MACRALWLGRCRDHVYGRVPGCRRLSQAIRKEEVNRVLPRTKHVFFPLVIAVVNFLNCNFVQVFSLGPEVIIVFIRRDMSMVEQFSFSDLREVFAKANEEKSGDQLAGLAARSERERVAAKRKLADTSLAEIVQRPLIDPDADDVSRLILDSFKQGAFQPIKSMTVGEFREYILDDATDEAELKRLQWAIIPEIAAAVAKS